MVTDVVPLPPADRAGSRDLSAVRPEVADALRALARVADVLTGDAITDADGREAAVVAAQVAHAVSRLAAAKVRLLPVIEADGLWAVDGARSFPTWVAEQHDMSVQSQWAALADPDADDRGSSSPATASTCRSAAWATCTTSQASPPWSTARPSSQPFGAVATAPAPDDTRTAAQRRAQALADLARLTLDGGLAGGHRSVRPRITVLIDHPTFTQLCQTARTAPTQGSLLPDGSLRTPPCVSALHRRGNEIHRRDRQWVFLDSHGTRINPEQDEPDSSGFEPMRA